MFLPMCVLQMAWNSCKEEAMSRIKDHLNVSNFYVRWDFAMAVARSILLEE